MIACKEHLRVKSRGGSDTLRLLDRSGLPFSLHTQKVEYCTDRKDQCAAFCPTFGNACVLFFEESKFVVKTVRWWLFEISSRSIPQLIVSYSLCPSSLLIFWLSCLLRFQILSQPSSMQWHEVLEWTWLPASSMVYCWGKTPPQGQQYYIKIFTISAPLGKFQTRTPLEEKENYCETWEFYRTELSSGIVRQAWDLLFWMKWSWSSESV